MTGVTLSADALNQAQVSGQQLVEATGLTFSSNSGWFLLVASIGLILFIVFYIMRRIARLGR